MAQAANAVPPDGVYIDNAEAPIRARRLETARIRRRSIRTQAHERNTRPLFNKRETRPRQLNREGNEPPAKTPTFQRAEPGDISELVSAAAALAHIEKSSIKIPMTWWKTFLPSKVYKRTRLNPETQEYEAINFRDPANKRGRHYPQLERLDLPAKTKNYVLDRQGRRHNIIANARPLLLYTRTNTLDRPKAEKKCAYGKIRDKTTNSWRCIKNPDHHKVL
jgi:hypothetical protein